MDCVDSDALGAGHAPDEINQTAKVATEARRTAGGGQVVRMPMRFQVIDGGRASEVHERPKMWLCKTCETDIGVATSVVEPVWQGPLREAGRVRLSSGTKRVVCTHCKMRGKLTFVD